MTVHVVACVQHTSKAGEETEAAKQSSWRRGREGKEGRRRRSRGGAVLGQLWPRSSVGAARGRAQSGTGGWAGFETSQKPRGSVGAARGRAQTGTGGCDGVGRMDNGWRMGGRGMVVEGAMLPPPPCLHLAISWHGVVRVLCGQQDTVSVLRYIALTAQLPLCLLQRLTYAALSSSPLLPPPCQSMAGSGGSDVRAARNGQQTGVAFLLALADANNLSLSPAELIELDRLIENGFLGLRNGVLDQSAIVLSKSGHLTRIWCQDRRHDFIPLPAGTPSDPNEQGMQAAIVQSSGCNNPSRLHLGCLRHAGGYRSIVGLQQSEVINYLFHLTSSWVLLHSSPSLFLSIPPLCLPDPLPTVAFMLAFSGMQAALTSSSGYNKWMCFLGLPQKRLPFPPSMHLPDPLPPVAFILAFSGMQAALTSSSGYYYQRCLFSLLKNRLPFPPTVYLPAPLPTVAFILAFSGMQAALASSSGYNNRVQECQEAARMLLVAAGLDVPSAPVLSQGLRVVRKGGGGGFLFEAPFYEAPQKQDWMCPLLLFYRKDHLPEALRRRTTHFFSESARVLQGAEALQQGDWQLFGRLMSESGQSSIDLYEFSGAGFRGCCVALVEREKVADVARHVAEEYSRRQPELAAACQKDSMVVVCDISDGARIV
ncbi:unnamed protein product [Closterium sp. NIES-65]|nr:unnamed protein product [Closterium sp. NIES-65]